MPELRHPVLWRPEPRPRRNQFPASSRHRETSPSVGQALADKVLSFDQGPAPPVPRLRWPSLSIRTTVLLAILVAVLGPALALWHVDQALTRRANEPLIEQSRGAVLSMTAAALVQPLWTIDTGSAAAVAKQALAEPNVLGVQLTEQRPLAPVLRLERPGEHPERGIAMKVPIAHEGEPLGELEIWFDPDQLERSLSERRRATLQLAALQVVMTGLLLLAVLYRRVLQPVERLKSQASAMASREVVTPPVWRQRDELGQLGHHLNDVHRQIGTLFDQLEQQKADLQEVALHDGLTGLPNRMLFQELLAQAAANARRDGGRLALLFIDLDRFKSVNDTIGHACGDTLLQIVANRLRATVRESDVVCRHSGDEFIVLLREANAWDEVASTADRMLKAIETPVFVKFRDIHVSASIGISMFPDDAEDPEALVRHADTAMYESKHLGRARFSFYRADLNSQLHATLQLEQELKAGLAGDQFTLYYQPLVSARTGQILGCEALIRWQHPERGMVPPMQFIGAAEQCGLISEIGAWTIRTACAQIAQWKRDNVPFGTVAINVSALEFRHHRLVDTLTQAMIDFEVLPHELEIEITESVLMTDTETTQRIVDDLHQLGLRLAVDDFGTGYSSLAYLKRLRPSKIKIDRSFVRQLPEDENDRVLVQAVIQLAVALGIRVVAEGVETEAQRAFLRDSGCNVLQGYLIARPQPAEQFARFAIEVGADASSMSTAMMSI